MIHCVFEIILGLILWKYIPEAVKLRDFGFERIIKIVLGIVGILMTVGGIIGLIRYLF